MIVARNPSCLPTLALAIVLGVVACIPSTSTANETTAVDAINPMTSAREAVIASMRKLMNARSYHVSMKMSGASKAMMANEVDFVAPDRFRMVMANIGTQVIIGNTIYMSVKGRSMKMPMPRDITKQWRDPEGFRKAEAGMSAESMGSEAVDGIAARKYKVRQSVPTTSEYILWIGADGLPLQMRLNTNIKGTAATMTMRYSRINDPSLSISVPE